MRFDPRLKYLADIAARKQRRSLANFVEWTVEQALAQVHLSDPNPLVEGSGETVLQASSRLWDLEERDRLIKLALGYPDLLTYEEQLIWRVIISHFVCWEDDNGVRVSRFYRESGVQQHLVRDCWTEIKAFALGACSEDELNKALMAADEIHL